MSLENGSFLERGVEAKNLAGFYRNLQETTGIYRNPQESAGNCRNLQEMSKRVGFHAKLVTEYDLNMNRCLSSERPALNHNLRGVDTTSCGQSDVQNAGDSLI